MELNRNTAESALTWAGQKNPGNWIEHSRFVALACQNIAAQCEGMDADQAYCFGLLHDIGRYAGVSSERHLIDGYRFCMEKGWEKAAQICISHAFMIKDIHTSIGTFDVTEEDFCFMEKFIKTAVYDDYDPCAVVRRTGAAYRFLHPGKAFCGRDDPLWRPSPHSRQMEESAGDQSRF